MFDLFLTPLLSVSLAAYITILFVGPIFVWLENNILGLLMWLLQVPFGIGYIIIGLIYSPSVVTGLHQMYTAIDVSMLAQYGVTYWLPIASAASIAQGGTCLAVALKTHSEKTKSLAVPAGISCLLGITEPAIFGVNLPNMKPFVAGMIGSACGALCCFIFNLAASGTGVTGIFGILLCIRGCDTSSCSPSPLAWRSQSPRRCARTPPALPSRCGGGRLSRQEKKPRPPQPQAKPETIGAPATGTAVSLTDVSDPVFASLAMGKGIAVEPTDGKIVSPVDGTVTVVAETGHALGLLSDSGAEILIHIGIDTVELKGAPFTPLAKVGDHVRRGDVLMEADLGVIEAAGKKATTMLVITNTDAYASVDQLATGAVKAGDAVVATR